MKCVAVEITPWTVASFRNERRDFAQIVPFDYHKQIVAARHQVTRLHFAVLGDALREADRIRRRARA